MLSGNGGKEFSLLYKEKLPQVVGNLDYDDLCAVPWGHHRVIIDRCKGDSGNRYGKRNIEAKRRPSGRT